MKVDASEDEGGSELTGATGKMDSRENQEGNEALDFLVDSLLEVADFLARDLQQRKSSQVQEWGISWKKEGKPCPLGYQVRTVPSARAHLTHWLSALT